MGTLLEEIMFRNYNSSLLRQNTLNKSLFLIYVYTSADLGRVLMNFVALLWVEDGQHWVNARVLKI
jgi:hypothetical protein